MMIKAKHIKESDIFFVQFDEGRSIRTIMRKPDILIDLDKNDRPLSMEIVGVKDTPINLVCDVIHEFKLGRKLGGLLRLAQAVKISDEKIQNRKSKDLRDLQGKISFSPGYDYKALRRGK